MIRRQPVTTNGGCSTVTMSHIVQDFFSTSALISTVNQPSLFGCLCLWSVMPDLHLKTSELPTETALCGTYIAPKCAYVGNSLIYCAEAQLFKKKKLNFNHANC